jgi:Stage II sporulation protein E (SpoIIE)
MVVLDSRELALPRRHACALHRRSYRVAQLRGEEFGDERLLDSLRRHNTLGACAIAQAVVKDVAQFSAGDQFDDITLIIAKRMVHR